MPTVVSLYDRRDPKAIVKGPATDASMITRMKRQQAIVSDLKSHPSGRKDMGAVVDGQMTRGFNSTSIHTTFINQGASLGFFRVL